MPPSIKGSETMSISEAQGGVLGFRFKKIIDESGAPAVTYIGYADPNTATSENKWLIIRVSVVGTTTTTEFSNGSLLFKAVWDDRATTSYS